MAEIEKNIIILEAETQKGKVREILQHVESGILAVYDSDAWKKYLACLAKFYDYSANNTLLIWMQMPEASLVAGFTSWRDKFHRSVKSEEKGIRILAPCKYPKKAKKGENEPGEDDENEEIVKGFKIAYVFDVSQTDGEPLPTIDPGEMDGNVPHYDAFFDALRHVSPVPICFEATKGSVKGCYRPVEKTIAIKEGMSEIQTAKTAIHEIAHSKMHALDEKGNLPPAAQDRRTREVQAEATAFVVCSHFGLDVSDYSFPYLASWSSGRELTELRASIDTIHKTARELIEGIEAHMAQQIAC